MSGLDSFWKDRRVFLTGHTGFKGGWLSLWLQTLGAKVHGYSLAPPTQPNFFDVARVSEGLASDVRGDIRDFHPLVCTLRDVDAEVVFHLAAQPLVRVSYRDPLESFSTNVMGTAHILQAARQVQSVRAVVIVTTDKCYENREWVYPYRECDRLGGHDPYSASKACAELVTSSYRDSFFRSTRCGVASVRAGNVMGGGDWAEDRLVPDCVRAMLAGQSVELRNPSAIRPWQHVLEPLAGYLMLAEKLYGAGEAYRSAWNFGPGMEGDATVGQIAAAVARGWCDADTGVAQQPGNHPHEALTLRLDSSKSRHLLGWRPCWSLARSVDETVSWYRAWRDGQDMREYTLTQISAYEECWENDSAP